MNTRNNTAVMILLAAALAAAPSPALLAQPSGCHIALKHVPVDGDSAAVAAALRGGGFVLREDITADVAAAVLPDLGDGPVYEGVVATRPVLLHADYTPRSGKACRFRAATVPTQDCRAALDEWRFLSGNLVRKYGEPQGGLRYVSGFGAESVSRMDGRDSCRAALCRGAWDAPAGTVEAQLRIRAGQAFVLLTYTDGLNALLERLEEAEEERPERWTILEEL